MSRYVHPLAQAKPKFYVSVCIRNTRSKTRGTVHSDIRSKRRCLNLPWAVVQSRYGFSGLSLMQNVGRHAYYLWDRPHTYGSFADVPAKYCANDD